MPKILLEKLRALQCHFTWDITFEALVDVNIFLTHLTHKGQHTPYCNRGLYIAMKAFLYYLQRRYAEALSALLEAETVLMQDHPTNFLVHSLVAYGNYAWIYYYLANFPKVEFYLAEIHRVCQSLNSSQPYSAMTPEIMGQKGWSLLVRGPQTGEKAMKCFQMALREDPSNEEFKGGLASSLYALWKCFRTAYYSDMAKELLEEIVLTQPQNHEAKLYLANLLLDQDEERANWHLEDAVQNSLSADVLREAASLCIRSKPPRVSQAVFILRKAIILDPSDHFLYYDLGMYYKYHMMVQVSSEERAAILEAATVSFQQAAEIDTLFIFPMLELAKIYGETVPAYEEEIYLRLMEELPMVSSVSQQAIYLFWGDFLLHQKGQKHEALEIFVAGLRIANGRLKEKHQLKERLVLLAGMFQEDSDMDRVDSIYSFLQTMESQEADDQTGDLCWHSQSDWR